MDKRSLRKTIRGLKAEFSSDELRQCSRPIVDKLLSHPKVTLSHTILAYLSMEDEVDTHQLVDRLLAEGHRILLPVVVDDTNLEVREYTGRECLLRQGKYQIVHMLYLRSVSSGFLRMPRIWSANSSEHSIIIRSVAPLKSNTSAYFFVSASGSFFNCPFRIGNMLAE